MYDIGLTEKAQKGHHHLFTLRPYQSRPQPPCLMKKMFYEFAEITSNCDVLSNNLGCTSHLAFTNTSRCIYGSMLCGSGQQHIHPQHCHQISHDLLCHSRCSFTSHNLPMCTCAIPDRNSHARLQHQLQLMHYARTSNHTIGTSSKIYNANWHAVAACAAGSCDVI